MVVSGRVRLVIELGVFAAAVALVSFVSSVVALALGIAVAIHYLLSMDRIRWLLRN